MHSTYDNNESENNKDDTTCNVIIGTCLHVRTFIVDFNFTHNLCTYT